MKVTIEINCDGFADREDKAFGPPYNGDEVARLLHGAASMFRGIHMEPDRWRLIDTGENDVGEVRIVDDSYKSFPKVEDCIAWAQQNGYYLAGEAAAELGEVTGREMYEFSAMYGAYTWRNQG